MTDQGPGDGHARPGDPGASPPPPSGPAPADGNDGDGSGDDAVRGPQDLGREFSGRAAQPGDTGERLDAERDARSSFGRADVRAHQVVGGDQYNIFVGSDGEHVRLFPLSAVDVDEASTFVEPDGFSAQVESVRDSRVVALRAELGKGRYAAARALLVRAGCGSLYRLHPTTDLGRLSLAALEPGGYILADPPASDGSALTAFDLERLASELHRAKPRHANSRLVITITPDLRLGDSDVGKHVLDLGAAPDRMEVLRAHLSWRFGPGSQPQVERILARPDVAALIREELGDDTPLGRVAKLASLLFESRTPEDEIASTVSARLADTNKVDFELWLENLSDLSTQCLAIAVAVLGGEPYETVAAAAAALQQRLEPPEASESSERSRSDPFRASRSRRLAALHAHLVTSDGPVRHGGAPSPVVRYQDPEVPERTLLYVWHEYDDVRASLLAWLRTCARHEIQTARVRAAVATGVLASQAFDHIRAMIILPWASDPDPRLRDAAAIALRVAADEPPLRPVVCDLVHAWSTDAGNPRLQATATRAWRVELEADGPKAALALLEEVGGAEHVVVKEAVCDSVSELIEIDDGAFAPDALGLLLRWAQGRKAERRLTGMLAFLLAAADLVRQVPALSGPERSVTWPTLLHVAARDPERQRDVAALWASVLNSADLHATAKEILTEWDRTAAGEPVVHRSLYRLLAAAGSTPRTKRIIRNLVSGWETGGDDLLALLEEGPSH